MRRSALIVALAVCGCVSLASGEPVKVEVKGEPGKYELLRGGKPYFIMGAGGGGPQSLLASIGANSGRTWGADNLQAQLDEAQRLGLTLTVGIWLGHPRHGFNYNDPKQVGDQLEMARQAILKYKDHPALLMWGVGNEMEGEGNDAAIWSAINSVASLCKRLDPNHPTMTVVAELGDKGQKVKNIHRLCSDIDIVGINAYGGGPSVAERYKQFGGTKPFVITEFGPLGAWEIGRNDFGAPSEQSSTQKAEAYAKTYDAAVLGAKGMCLGSYAFTWGHKFEATATWFGMLLPDDRTRLAACDVLSERWTGKPPANRVPAIESLKTSGKDRGKPGEKLNLTLTARDPESDPLTVEWVVLPETAQYDTGGDPMKSPDKLASAVSSASQTGATVTLPEKPGVYRVYVYVRDNHGGGATASLPVLSGEPPTPKK